MGFDKATGTRAEVWHGTAKHTSGRLTKPHLMMNKWGRIVSRKKHTTASREKRLVKAGYGTQKGRFGWVSLNKTGKQRRGAKRGRRTKRRRTRKR